MTDMESKAHFDSIADMYENLRPVFMPLMDNLAKVMEIKENDVVVDFGCGPGHDIKYLMENYHINPVAVDKSKEMCRVASSKIGCGKVINGDSLSCLWNVRFDKIYFKFVMHHIKRPIQFVDDLVNRLKMGDEFAIVTMLPSHVESYEMLKYFPSLTSMLKTKAQEQQKVFEHLWQNKQITFNCLECDVNEEVFDEFMIYKLENNYSSFFSIISNNEKRQGIEKVRNQLDTNNKNSCITKGVIGYGKKYRRI